MTSCFCSRPLHPFTLPVRRGEAAGAGEEQGQGGTGYPQEGTGTPFLAFTEAGTSPCPVSSCKKTLSLGLERSELFFNWALNTKALDTSKS